MPTDAAPPQTLSFGPYYGYVLAGILRAPRRFFGQMQPGDGTGRPLGVLVASSLVFVGAGIVTGRPAHPALQGVLWFANAVGMVFLTVGIGYVMAVAVTRRRVSITCLFSVYALCSGTTLLFAWLPFSLWITEPWKWWLVATGLIHCCAFSRRQALMIISLTFGILTLLFWTVLPSVGHQPV